MTTDIHPQSLTIDTSLELVADQYTARLPRTDVYRTAARTDRLAFHMSQLQPDGITLTPVKTLPAGVVDEYELALEPDTEITTVRGRDLSALALDNIFRKDYLRKPLVTPSSPPTPTYGAAFPATPYEVGTFAASTIAAEAVASVGGRLEWRVRDYLWQVDYHANKRVIDIVRDMAAPWMILEPFRAVIWLEGQEDDLSDLRLVVDYQYPLTLLPPADLTLTAKEARRLGVIIRKRPMKKIGRVTLRGKVDTTAGVGTLDLTSETEAFDIYGQRQSRVVTTTTVRLPDMSIIEKIVEDTYIKPWWSPVERHEIEKTTYFTYDPPEVAPDQDTMPVLKQKVTTTKRFLVTGTSVGGAGVWTLTDEEDMGLAYDDNGFLKNETTITKKWSAQTAALENFSMAVRTLEDVGPLLHRDSRDEFSWQPDVIGMFMGTPTAGDWVRQGHAEQTVGGHRPGGPGRGKTGPQITYQVIVNTDPDAQDFEYSNQNLSLEDLTFMAAAFLAADLLWEYELTLPGISAAVTRKQVVQITNATDSNGNALPLPPCVIRQLRFRHDEQGEPRSELAPALAFGWSLT